jgi:large subunit ribosomal protein L1
VIHVPIGKASFDEARLKENLAALVDAVVRAKPQAAKGQYIRSVALAPTMGPAVKLEVQPTLALAATS